MPPAITVHVLPPSHPCMTAEAALRLKGLEYERVVLESGRHGEAMEAIYGAGHTTVPGIVVDGEPVHGSLAITARLEKLVPEPPLFPAATADAVREAEAWGDRELQDLGRRLPWCAMHFRPEAMGTFGGADPLDPPGTDFAIRFVRAAWKYHGISAVRVAEDLAGLPAKLDRVDALIRRHARRRAGQRRGPADRGDPSRPAVRRRPPCAHARAPVGGARAPLVPGLPRPRAGGGVPGGLAGIEASARAARPGTRARSASARDACVRARSRSAGCRETSVGYPTREVAECRRTFLGRGRHRATRSPAWGTPSHPRTEPRLPRRARTEMTEDAH